MEEEEEEEGSRSIFLLLSISRARVVRGEQVKSQGQTNPRAKMKQKKIPRMLLFSEEVVCVRARRCLTPSLAR